MSLPRYPEYKDSGVGWLGLLPKAWQARRLKLLFELKKRPTKPEDQIITCFRDGQVTLRNNRRTEGFTNALQEIGYQGIRKGDLVIHAMDAFAGAIGVSDSEGKATPVYSVCSPMPNVSADYYGYLLRNMALSGFVESLAKGIRERSTDFRWADASVIELPFPSYREQETVARFLDHETAKIDALIQEQQRLIKLLKEKRQAVISHAVTKGLDPSVPMKDSGVEWLGEVPEHWDVFSLKRSVDGCTNGLWGDEPDGEDDLAVIRVADFDRSSSRVGLEKLTYRSVTPKERASRLLEPGDLLIEKSGGGEKTLVGCVVLFRHDFPAITSNFVARMRPLGAFGSGFLCYAFDTLYQGKVNYPAIKQTTGIQNLDSEAYLQEYFCFPPPVEQFKIACFLDHEIAKIDALIQEQQRLIKLLKERRSALISAAVTGKIDVRNWQPPADESAFDEEVRQAGLEVAS